MLKIIIDEGHTEVAFSGDIIQLCAELTKAAKHIRDHTEGFYRFAFERYIRDVFAGVVLADSEDDTTKAIVDAIMKIGEQDEDETEHKQD